MKRVFNINAVLLLLLFCLACERMGYVKTTPGRNDIKVLFIGSSYFGYNNMPGIFKSLVMEGNKKVYYDFSITNGKYLSDHASSDYTYSKINLYDWDYVFLQGVGTNVAFPDSAQNIFPPYVDHPWLPSMITLLDSIKTNYINGIPIFTMPWAFKDGMTWLDGFDQNYEEMQEIIYENTIKYSDEIGYKIAPVGWAWKKVIEERPDIELFLSDYNHPSSKGTYLMACVFYVCVFQESVEGNSFYNDLIEEEAKYLQKIASEVVLQNLDLWRLENFK